MARGPGFFLGGIVDPTTGERGDERMVVEPGSLTTHGVIVGMTGSGKTGLGVILLEEAARAGIPALVIDPKGDMGNLALRFPELSESDFRAWVSPDDARRADLDLDGYAAGQADAWRSGLDGWGLGAADVRELHATSDVAVYTPGSAAGIPLNVLGAMAPPAAGAEQDSEAVSDEIEGLSLGLLGLVGIDADPISGREHILLSQLIHHAWARGQGLDLARLIGLVQRPPLRKLGVFDIDAFYPDSDRQALAMRLNGLLASPTFAAWLTGPPLDVPALLGGRFTAGGGKPRTAVLTLSHLSEPERQFIVTLVLSRVVTWMRGLSGTGDLRALIYMDEVFGYAPPSAQPPSKKPILTLLKQARAYGVGLVLATQNPVDLDYKAISNAGTWFVGRLQTQRDRSRLVDGMARQGGWEKGEIDARIAGLGKRQFLIYRAGAEPSVFQTRWALSYLRGPLSREEIGRLRRQSPQGDAALPTSGAAALAADESLVAPPVAPGINMRWLDPSAPWMDRIGADPDSRRFEAALAVTVRLLFDDRYASVDHTEEWEAVFHPLREAFDADAGVDVDHDARDFRPSAPEGAIYALPKAPLSDASYCRSVETQVKDALYAQRGLELFKNPELKLYSRVGEAESDFAERCRAVAEDSADSEASTLRARYESKLRKIQARTRQADRRVEELEAEAAGRQRDELLSGAGALLSAFLGGRSRTGSLVRSLGSASRRRRMTTAAQNRIETAVDKAALLEAEMEALEAELADALVDIDERWSRKAQAIEPLRVGLEKNDIAVQDLIIVWVPMRRPDAQSA